MLFLALRYGLPALLIVVGFVMLFTVEGNLRWDGWAMCVGSGLSILLSTCSIRFGRRATASGRMRPRRASSTPSTATGPAKSRRSADTSLRLPRPPVNDS